MFATRFDGRLGYLAAKSEAGGVRPRDRMERKRSGSCPEVRRKELALVYQTKASRSASRARMAAEVMRDSQRALDEQVRKS